jgi:KDO2-lipid IV(A) lauroyltransferase
MVAAPRSSPRRKKKKRKSEALQLLEYLGVVLIIRLICILPLNTLYRVGALLGDACYLLLSRRRRIALDNVSCALGGVLGADRVRSIARHSFRSFFYTIIEVVKIRFELASPEAVKRIRAVSRHLDGLILKARRIHDEAGGCIFVTPHFGNWELLPHVSSSAGIPLAVVARPLDNPHLEKMLYADRASSGQLIVPKRNALFVLQRILAQGKSVALLPDQSTKKGIAVEYFGRKAMTTPAPALLAVAYGRPIVVVACFRTATPPGFDGVVSDPLWPRAGGSEKAEILRLTAAVHGIMEEIIREHPEQYLWLHNRWKAYAKWREFITGGDGAEA